MAIQVGKAHLENHDPPGRLALVLVRPFSRLLNFSKPFWERVSLYTRKGKPRT